MKRFFLLTALCICPHSTLKAIDTNEWFKAIYSGNPTSETVSNRICIGAEKWCLHELERNSIVRRGYSKRVMKEFCTQVLEDIRLHRFSTDDSHTDPIHWGGVVELSKRWYEIAEKERQLFEERHYKKRIKPVGLQTIRQRSD